MSYDLSLYRPTPGHSVEEADEEAAELFESGAEPRPTTFTAWTESELVELAQVVMSAAPEYAEGDEDGPIHVNGDGSICLQAPEEIFSDWTLGPLGLAVSWPYGREGDELRRVLDPVQRELVALKARGVRVYDTQLGRELDPERDFPALVAQYLSTNRSVFGGGGARPAPARKPWWKFW